MSTDITKIWQRGPEGARVARVMSSNSRGDTARRGPRARLTLLGALALSMVLSACADDKPLNTFEPAGPAAEEIDNLMMPIWVVMGVIGVLVVGGALWIAIRNRVDPETYDLEDLPAQLHGNTRLEVLWTALPGLLLAVIAIFTVQDIWFLEQKNDPGELDVMVIGQQWWWEYRYDVDGDGFFADVDGDGVAGDPDDMEWPLELALDPDDLVTANDLVIPAGQQVDLVITSRDVIHSYWIPRLNGKRDAVPGRFHTWSVEAWEPGKYTGWCTEFCGASHARMRMSVIALDEADYAAWYENQLRPADAPTEADAVAGMELFQANCTTCHVVDGGGIGPYPEDFEAALVAKAAPNLTHFATRITYAGSIYSQYQGPGTDANDDAFNVDHYVGLAAAAANPSGPDDYRWNAAELKRWVADASAQKDMAPDQQRGMTSFPQFSDEDLDNLVAYLATLD